MSRAPTRGIVRGDWAYDLVIARSFAAPIGDVWASVTEPERTARWFGAWRGEAGPGRTIALQMGFEEGMPWCDVRIEACDPPRRLAVPLSTTRRASGSWSSGWPSARASPSSS